MSISVVIPVFNKWELTRACLETLAQTSAGVDIEVIVVDNASTDATPEACPSLGKQLFGSNFIFSRQQSNRNFGPACNIGARVAAKDLLFFLNNDTILIENWLPPLLERLSAPPYPEVVGPLLLYPEFAGRKNRVQHLGVAFEPQFYLVHPYEGFPATHPVCSRPRRFQALTGAALLLRRELFLATGLFDEDFINGGEDVELCLRLTARNSIHICEPRSRIYHLASQTPGVHDHEAHNAKLLKQKAFNNIVPDLHSIAQEDGYILALAPNFGMYLDLPERRKSILNRQAERLQTTEEIEELLLAEPLCHSAYLKQASLWQKAGQPQKAVDTLLLALKLRKGDVSVAQKMAVVAKEAKNTTMLHFAQQIIAGCRGRNFLDVCDIAENMLRFAQQLNVPAIQLAYSNWLAQKEENMEWFGSHGHARSTTIPET